MTAFGRRRLFLVVAISAAVVFTSITEADAAEKARSVTICFYDLSEDLDVPPKPLDSHRAGLVAETLQSTNADIIVLAGLAGEKDFSTIKKLLGDKFVFAKAVSGPAPTGLLAIFSNLRPTSCEDISGLKYNIKKNTPVPVGNDFIKAVFDINGYRLQLFAGILKNRSKHPKYSQTNMRRYEARELRKLATAILRKKPDANIMVLGNFNDTCGKSPLNGLYSRRSGIRKRLFDIRPVDHINVAWTAVDERRDEHERIDYMLASSGLVPEVGRNASKVVVFKKWRLVSAHRPIVTTVSCRDAKPWTDERLKKEFPYCIRYSKFPVGVKENE